MLREIERNGEAGFGGKVSQGEKAAQYRTVEKRGNGIQVRKER